MSKMKRRGAKQSSSSDIVYQNLTHNGEYEGRLRYVADLGLQERSYKGEEKDPAQQLSLGIEILGEFVEIDGKDVPRLLWTRPMNVFWTLTEKGKELEFLKVFIPSAEEGEEAEWGDALDMPCNVIIENVPGKGANKDKVFDNIKSLSPIPAKYRKGVDVGVMTSALGDADDEENEATKALYGLAKFVWDKRLEEDDIPDGQDEMDGAPGGEDFEDDIPF
jgi:hypothetical protein